MYSLTLPGITRKILSDKTKPIFMLCRFTDTLLDPSIINTILISRRLGIKASKTGIRELFFAKCRLKPAISIRDICEVLFEIGITVTPARVSWQHLGKISAPFMILFEQKAESHFCLVVDRVGDELQVLDPYTNVVRAYPLGYFYGKDSIVLAIAKFNSGFMEEGYADRVAAEEAADAAYRESVRVIPGVFSPAECDAIVAYYEHNKALLEKSVVDRISADGKTFVEPSYSRTCEISLFSHFGQSEELLDRIAGVLGSSAEKFETPSILRYDVGQEFKIHHDAFNGDERRHTVLVYLNEDFEGGETFLPEIDLKVVPKKGSCLVFTNIDEQLQIIPQSLHSSLPIIAGVKYALITIECRNAFVGRREDDLVAFNRV